MRMNITTSIILPSSSILSFWTLHFPEYINYHIHAYLLVGRAGRQPYTHVTKLKYNSVMLVNF